MTDAQIEQIARAYCKRMGLDAEARILTTNGYRPYWWFRMQDVREAIAMREAIDEVLGEKGAGG